MKNRALSYLSTLKDAKVSEGLLARSRAATNMTDQIAALACLADSEGAPCSSYLQHTTCIDASHCLGMQKKACTGMLDKVMSVCLSAPEL